MGQPTQEWLALVVGVGYPGARSPWDDPAKVDQRAGRREELRHDALVIRASTSFSVISEVAT
jgi:hypothetical protein